MSLANIKKQFVPTNSCAKKSLLLCDEEGWYAASTSTKLLGEFLMGSHTKMALSSLQCMGNISSKWGQKNLSALLSP
jgi:hypothetical protein